MAVNNAAAHSPWGPMPGAKPPGSGGSGPPAPPAGAHHASLLSYEDERRRLETAEANRRAQENFINSLRPPHSSSVNSMHPSIGGGSLPPAAVPPPAHGSMHRPSHNSSTTSKHSLPPSTVTAPPHAANLHHKPPPSHHHPHHHKIGDPGPPPPLAPLQSGGVASAHGPYKTQSNSAVTFKPYDFGRRDISPRGSSSSLPSGGGSAGGPASYPTAYSAPPPARPKVTSPQVVNLYSKPIPARPESVPAIVSGAGSSGGGASGPPPAHSSLPPGSRAPPPTKHLLPPPVAHSHPASGPRPQAEEDMPLDLGAPSKRKLESPELEAVTPAKTVKLEENGQLHKVSEPSVLMTSEVNITTVENLVLQPSSTKQEVKEEPSAGGQPASPPQYVHKLKKAWIKSYVDEKPANAASDGDTKKGVESSYSSPSTPINNNSRATPSPALSNVSAASKGGRRVNGHASSSTRNEESESSDSGSGRGNATTSSKKESAKGTSGKSNGTGRGGGKKGAKSHTPARGGRGSNRPSRTNKTSDNDTLSDSDDNSKDSDNTTVSRRSGTASTASTSTKGRRGRKPGRKNGRGGTGGGVSKNVTDASDDGLTEPGATINGGGGNGGKKKAASKPERSDGKPENPFNNPPINVLKKTGESFLQDADCFKVAPKLGKCRECKWSQHNKNAGSSTSIFCR